jgi:hypothetical protein
LAMAMKNFSRVPCPVASMTLFIDVMVTKFVST